jgi:hypothetical protein
MMSEREFQFGRRTFTVTPEHLMLLSRAVVDWQGDESGAPCIDCKRPYGNSNLEENIHTILTGERESELTREQWERYATLHRETQTALQIVLVTQSFVPGQYEADMHERNWRLVPRGTV